MKVALLAAAALHKRLIERQLIRSTIGADDILKSKNGRGLGGKGESKGGGRGGTSWGAEVCEDASFMPRRHAIALISILRVDSARVTAGLTIEPVQKREKM